MAPSITVEGLIERNLQLLNAITSKDFTVYESLVDKSITCFEPEAVGHLVKGVDFHRYYFQLKGNPPVTNTTMVTPHVRFLGDDAAVLSYVRMTQVCVDGNPQTKTCEETRVWQLMEDGTWKNVHMHRSAK